MGIEQLCTYSVPERVLLCFLSRTSPVIDTHIMWLIMPTMKPIANIHVLSISLVDTAAAVAIEKQE
jgi:hypothetical protein